MVYQIGRYNNCRDKSKERYFVFGDSEIILLVYNYMHINTHTHIYIYIYIYAIHADYEVNIIYTF